MTYLLRPSIGVAGPILNDVACPDAGLSEAGRNTEHTHSIVTPWLPVSVGAATPVLPFCSSQTYQYS